MNASIRAKMAEIEANYVEHSLSGRGGLLPKKEKVLYFNEYATMKLKEWERRDSPGTSRHKLSYLKKFNEFKSKIRLTEFTPDLLRQYEDYCRDLGNGTNTIWSSLKFVKTVINSAVNDNVIANNPMKGYKNTSYQSPQRLFLTEVEINKLEKFVLESNSFVNEANWFLFSCYCGLRFGDLVTFNRSCIIDGRIILRTSKAKTDVSIKIHPKLKAVIDRLGPNLTTNEDYNRKLKLIASACGIDKPLTSHLARHSFSVLCLNKGISMESVSKILGHTSNRTTQIYAKVTNLKLDDEIEKALGRKNYLFAGSHEAAQRGAMLYSLFATCRLHYINPTEWLVDVLSKIKNYKINQIEELLPQNYKK